MKRRSFFLMCFVLSLLLLAVLMGPRASAQAAPALAGTAGTPTGTATPTSMPGSDFVGAPLAGTAPLTVTFTHTNPSILSHCTWTFGDGTSQSFTPPTGTTFAACPSVSHTYAAGGSYSVSLTVIKATNSFTGSTTKPNYILVSDAGSPTPTAFSTNDLLPDLTITSINYVGSTPACANNPRDTVVVSNIGGGNAGPFVVSFGGQSQSVSGLGSGQQVTLSFVAMGIVTATADSTNIVAESNELNNSLSAQLPVPTQAWTCTPTGGPSFTPSLTPTLTRTPTITPTPTRTPTARTGGTCSPVTASIAAPFTKDGAGTFCWQASNLGSYINSWNMTNLSINGVNLTNKYVAAASLPAKINGFWYVSYTGNFAWSHFEAK